MLLSKRLSPTHGLVVLSLLINFSLWGQDSSIPKSTPIPRTNTSDDIEQDSAIVAIENEIDTFLKAGESTKALYTLIKLTEEYGHRGNYSKSYETAWKALSIADTNDNEVVKSHIYRRLGAMYSFSKRKDEAIKYLRLSRDIIKGLVEKGKMKEEYLLNNYYTFVYTYRGLNEPELAKKYLDSCYIYYSDKQNEVALPYIKFEEAYVLREDKKYDEAERTLIEIEPWFQENAPSYLVLVYAYWAVIYKNTGQLKKATDYYKKAIAISDQYKSHMDFTPYIHEKLAEIYRLMGNYKDGYTHLNKAKALTGKFFDGRSKNNISLMEIKNEYRLEKERQQEIIRQQRMETLEQQDKILMLQRIILASSLIFVIIIGFVYVKHIRSKHRAEKRLLEKTKALEMQKANELLETKNKELAASTLQLVEKEEFLKKLKNELQGEDGSVKISEINRVLKSISAGNANNWEEFKLRFTDVNKDFYEKLNSTYPNLSQTDQKICALIKLNLSSKDMARLLGISTKSVHTTRHRLRKKMGLQRSDNLEELIASL
ncbi:hypothetical protein [Zobellia galactanivorans]|uniref:hypothetical protein n=1 Tax=Zobellia galactanivorans (strain DSM 12802 / CCUG 47099 / CIP 106680 / NCIMB 13871 / Dsij) TaxID=63186 RepID=UPI001C07E82F|nr:hypothetical protein [Zobellia galactanivorans]MBU3024222.1 hypothetical protein [Zobellia galactanivorans]